MKKHIKYFWLILFVFAITLIVLRIYNNSGNLSYLPGVARVVSVSTDGNYAITSDDNNCILLWNLKNKRNDIISRKGNIYSAYFIKNSHNFMWQDLNDAVHIQNIYGKEIKSFKPGFASYGEVITQNLTDYIATDRDNNVYIVNLINKNKARVLWQQSNNYMKLINLTLSSDDKMLLISPEMFALIYNFNVATNNDNKVRKLIGNYGLVSATFSPDENYVVSGDNNSNAFVWNVRSGKKLFDLWSLLQGKCIGLDPKTLLYKYDASLLNVKAPKDFYQKEPDGSIHFAENILSLKFIDEKYYLRFTNNISYAVLYEITNPKPLKYFSLGNNIMPSVQDYAHNESIDTSPSAHILVTGIKNLPGIIVYKYNPENKILHQIWIGKIGHY